MPINGPALKAARERLGLTQEQVADAARMHRGSYNRLENEKKKETSGSKLRRIAKLLGVPMEALITDD